MPEADRGPSFRFYTAGFFLFFGFVFLVYSIERTQTVELISVYTILFALYLWCLLNRDEYSFNQWKTLAAVIRLSLLFAIPALSDDFYRFIWDGRLLTNGINPFSELPVFFMNPDNQVPGLTADLFSKLNSPEYFTIYPPLNQFIFWMSALIGGDSILASVIVMRLFLLAAEIGTIWLFPVVLDQYGLSRKLSLIYLLNPIVIIETVGNLHFEGMMFFFVLLALWLMNKNKLVVSALSMTLAICTKLIPLIFLIFLPKPYSFRRMLVYYGVTSAALIVIFFPLIDLELIRNFGSSVSLYFQRFEFNGSFYLILREIGFAFSGYNMIQQIGRGLVIFTFLAIMALAFWPFGKKAILTDQLFFALGIYFMMSTTVHPWYVITVLGLSAFTRYKSPILWSFLIFLTYIGYTADGFDLPLWVLFVEYGLVYGMFLFELSKQFGWWARLKPQPK
ncbi:MAG: polyprenol phosphomannose-dependent alpha 1,6 mannosyltransferase MptB [Bacteroidetes bacterium]|nr:polyprenol phosphomannose-dependent alpha 1,6 mannosyltransferase MptB [Bacteroidota bacterium]MDA1121653.1 polyprenol phosphomannose-dependent alpha 1,6 mannosyltransferase MptB [Bacteroidota bacterium]